MPVITKTTHSLQLPADVLETSQKIEGFEDLIENILVPSNDWMVYYLVNGELIATDRIKFTWCEKPELLEKLKKAVKETITCGRGHFSMAKINEVRAVGVYYAGRLGYVTNRDSQVVMLHDQPRLDLMELIQLTEQSGNYKENKIEY